MRTFKIKQEKTDKEKKILNLNNQLIIKDVIELQCRTINGLNDYNGIVEIRRWYIDENNVLFPEAFIKMHYNEIVE